MSRNTACKADIERRRKMPIGALGLARAQFVPSKMEGAAAKSAEGMKFQDVFIEKRERAGEPMSAAKDRHQYKNEYFNRAVDGCIVQNGVLFTCDYKTDTLCLGDCSDKRSCIQVELENGGSLMVNRDNLEDLTRAISLFSPEDQSRIMAAIQRDKMAKHNLDKIEEEISEGIAHENEREDDGSIIISSNMCMKKILDVGCALIYYIQSVQLSVPTRYSM